MPNRPELHRLLATERAAFASVRPRSQALARDAREHLLMGVPMPWMVRWSGGFPLFLDHAEGARVTDADGHEYVDLALGDTGAMTGHSPPPVTEAIAARRGITAMMPTPDALAVSAQLARRFGVPAWQFTLSATDANRFALRMCRQVQQRPKVLMFQWCYHGSVDESVAALDEHGAVRPKPGNVGPPVDVALTTRLAEFNDLEAVREQLAHEDVACVLAEPALTNVGMVLPEPGFLAALEEACRETGTLLIYDETHTFSAGPGGCVRAWGLRPDLVTLGKALGAGVPIGAYGVSAAVRDRILADDEGDYYDWGGVGGTLAGNALSLAAARATLEQVLTDDAFDRMTAAATRYREGVEALFADHGLPWSIVQLGARAEFHYTPEPPRTGGEAHAAIDELLDEVLHVLLLNRGVMLTPFHNMALFGPATSQDDVDRVLRAFDQSLAEVVSHWKR
jgi:glutamate-1-semialdehyde 2,1-aminomutase